MSVQINRKKIEILPSQCPMIGYTHAKKKKQRIFAMTITIQLFSEFIGS